MGRKFFWAMRGPVVILRVVAFIAGVYLQPILFPKIQAHSWVPYKRIPVLRGLYQGPHHVWMFGNYSIYYLFGRDGNSSHCLYFIS